MFLTYASEDFDVAQQVAVILTEDDRKNGLFVPEYGYSENNFELALLVIRELDGYISFQIVLEGARERK